MSANYIIWTRMQAEAGQGLDRIIKRKERERQAGEGLFFWGVGNAPSVLINSMARTTTNVPVIFSRMKTKPKPMDENPTTTVLWRQYIDYEGAVRPLPETTLVTSRGESLSKRKKFHYALQCQASEPLQITSEKAPFYPDNYRNAGGTGAPVGHSQVTSLLVANKLANPNLGTASYRVDLKANLCGSYWIRLLDPAVLPAEAILAIDRSDEDSGDWTSFVQDLKASAVSLDLDNGEPFLI